MRIVDARLVIGAVIIKHKLCLSDEETVLQIQEIPYLQYFAGLPGYTCEPPFAPSLVVEIRKRMGQTVFESFHQAILGAVQTEKAKSERGGSGAREAKHQPMHGIRMRIRTAEACRVEKR